MSKEAKNRFGNWIVIPERVKKAVYEDHKKTGKGALSLKEICKKHSVSKSSIGNIVQEMKEREAEVKKPAPKKRQK